MKVIRILLLFHLLLAFVGCEISLKVNWDQFLARSDPLWGWKQSDQSQPKNYYQSAFVGNGNLGAMIWTEEDGTLRLEISRTDIYDDRQPGKSYYNGNFAIDRPRLPIGYFNLFFVGNPIYGDMRLHLYDAEMTGTIVTDKGWVQFRSIAASSQDIIILELTTSTGEASAQFTWTSYVANSSWWNSIPNYVPNPPVQLGTLNGISTATQLLLSGNSYTTAFKQTIVSLTHTIWYITVTPVQPSSQLDAVQKIQKGISTGLEQLLKDHRNWWHNYYQLSFFTFTDSAVESFYWIQMYKMASATRADRTIFDLQGPWMLTGTVWPDLHWDLNIQLVYAPVYVANRLDLGLSLVKYMDSHMQSWISNVPIDWQSDSANVPTGASALDGLMSCYWDYGPNCTTSPPSITGNMLWVLHNYWLQYRYSMDQSLLKSLFPLLRRSINFYIHILNKTNGVYHLPTTFSPEYPAKGPDTNYDLALLRWGLQTIQQAVQILKINDPLILVWKEIETNLVPYPTDKNGYMIAATVPLTISHRHYSHLFMIYPLKTLTNWKNVTQKNLAVESFGYWINVGGGDGLTGFARVGVATMNVLARIPKYAYSNITDLLAIKIHPNTMYDENGWPCGETPPGASSALQELVIQSFSGEIEVFPGVDDSVLTDISFHQFRAEGAFLVSGKRTNGVTNFVQIKSLAGEPCILRTDMKFPLLVDPPSIKLNVIDSQSVRVNLSAGQTAVIYSSTSPNTNFTISPSDGNGKFNFWGMHP